MINQILNNVYEENSEVLNSLHHIKVIYVFRGIRLLRLMEYIHVIVFLIKNNIKTFIYGHFIFLTVIFMFALFGFQFYGDKFEFNREIISAYNFNTFSSSFITVFNIITLENWYFVFIEASSYKNSKITLSMFYFISLILLGNMLVWHLFLAIMLDAFESMKKLLILQEENEEIEEETLKILKKYLKNEKEEELNNKESEFFYSVSLIEEIEEKEKITNSTQMIQSSTNIDEPFINMRRCLKKKSTLLMMGSKKKIQDIPSQCSLFIFSKTNFIRLFCFKITNYIIFDKLVIIFIILSTFKLAIESFYDKKDPSDNILKNISFFLSFSINIFFTFVIVVKSVSIGFIMSEKTFCRDKLNVVNLFAVIGFYLKLILNDNSELEAFFAVKLTYFFLFFFKIRLPNY